MSLDAAHDQLVSTLTTDADLTAWVNTHFATALTVLNGNRPLVEFRDSELPALVFEVGNGEGEPLNNGNYADVRQQLRFGLVWYEADFAAAFEQRKTLPDLVMKALMRNKTLSGTVSDATVESWSFAQGADNPHVHSARFVLALEYGLQVTG